MLLSQISKSERFTVPIWVNVAELYFTLLSAISHCLLALNLCNLYWCVTIISPIFIVSHVCFFVLVCTVPFESCWFYCSFVSVCVSCFSLCTLLVLVHPPLRPQGRRQVCKSGGAWMLLCVYANILPSKYNVQQYY